jgi:hypothetical protein
MNEVTRRGFFATLAAVFAGVKAWGKGAAPAPAEVLGPRFDDRSDGWGRDSMRHCETHDYWGYPPCPVPNCSKGHPRDRYIAYRMAGFGQLEPGYDGISLGERREWVRDAPWMAAYGERRIVWREVGGRGTVFVAHESLGRMVAAEHVRHD